MKNRSLLFDVLNNDFTEKTRGMDKKAKIRAIEAYFASKSLDGTVSFAFVNGECVDTRLKKGQTYRTMIENAERQLSVDLNKGEKVNLQSIYSENAIGAYSHWLKGDRSHNLDASCVVYVTDKEGQPAAVLGVVEGYYTKNDFGVRFDSICLPETDYITGAEMVREREQNYNNDEAKPDNSSFEVLKERLIEEDEKEIDQELDLPGVGELLEDLPPLVELTVEKENDGIVL